MTPPLACTVRDCGLLLERRGGTYVCARRHSYDVARHGYVNLLQPTDRRSLDAGDSREAISARARLLASGLGRRILDAVATEVATHMRGNVVLDLGSGAGELLGTIAERQQIVGIGIDLSTAGVEQAARRYPHLTWVVANADRRLPVIDRTVDVIVSLHGRRNPAECARVLARDGRLIVAIPGAEDLIELRAAIQGERVERDRVASLVAEHAHSFEVVQQTRATESHQLTPPQLRDLLRGTYRGERTSAAARLASLESMSVTLASEIVVFAPS
jgi:23S rRNA (guanine745-N1)-methyltransferase